jgi:mono/diheme cytochrome c family protein
MTKNGGRGFQNASGSLVARAAPLALVLALALAACEKPLPELGTPAEQLYAAKCGSCHRAYNPHSLTAPMWQVQTEAMQVKIVAAGQRPLTPEQQNDILAYLKRNAGG